MKRSNKRRDYLLPKGCKDLIDVLRKKQESGVRTIMLPPVISELTVPDMMIVGELADALKQKPSKIIADFKKLSLRPVSTQQGVYFHEIIQVARLYGFTVKKAC